MCQYLACEARHGLGIAAAYGLQQRKPKTPV
jgi:hypothetical protein